MKTDASDRLARLLNIEVPEPGYEVEQAMELAANEIERLRLEERKNLEVLADSRADLERERERCARVADAELAECEQDEIAAGGNPIFFHGANAAKRIAAAIRGRKNGHD